MPSTGRPRARRGFSKKLPSREELIERAKARLLRYGLPRLQMSILVALTGAAGFLSSYALLQAGVASMAVRYPIAVAAAYGVLLLLLRIWLVIQERGWGEAVDAGDVVDLADGALDIAGEAADAYSGGGGSFGGGGASAHFDEPVSLGLSPPPRSSVPVPKSGGKGSISAWISTSRDASSWWPSASWPPWPWARRSGLSGQARRCWPRCWWTAS